MKPETHSLIAFVVVVAVIVAAAFIIGSNDGPSRQEAERSLIDNMAVLEIEQTSAKLQALIDAKRADLPANYVYAAPPVEFGSVEWRADLYVKVQYMRWQVEFLITLHNLEAGKRPDGKGRPIGQIIGDTNK